LLLLSLFFSPLLFVIALLRPVLYRGAELLLNLLDRNYEWWGRRLTKACKRDSLSWLSKYLYASTICDGDLTYTAI
jgi:hypothetical protein